MRMVFNQGEKDVMIYGAIITLALIFVVIMTGFTLSDQADGIFGPFALVIGMMLTIGYLIKRDKELRDQLNRQNEQLIKRQEEQIKELQAELKELRKK